MPVYFTSDHHFGQAAARTFYRRPFASVAEMDQEMIDRWNFVVSPGDRDEVSHLGDFPCANRRNGWRIYWLRCMAGSTSSSATTTTPWSHAALAGIASSNM